MNLNNTDIQTIENALINAGVKNNGLREEMVDHFCSEIELHFSYGVEKDQAINYMIHQLNSKDLKKLNTITNFQNSKKYIIMIIVMLIVSLFSATFFIQSNSETEEYLSENISSKTSFEYLEKTVNEPPYLWPLKTEKERITAGFGERRNPFTKKMQHHKGIDLKAEAGTLIQAPAAATVIKVDYNEKFGHYIILKHDEIYQTKYCHLQEATIEEGAQLKAGDIIGKVGSTGLSTGPHLHYEVIKNGENVDPKLFLKV